jgi:hypothetical protein
MRLHALFAVLLGSVLPALYGSAESAAYGRGINITATSAGLVVHGIPLPNGAEPSMAANLSLENLQALAPGSQTIGRGKLRAVVYHFPGACPPDELVHFYRRTLPVPLGLALPHRAQPNGAPVEDGVRVLPFRSLGGYLAIQARDVSRPAQVTVAMVEGNAEPAAILAAVDALVKGGDGVLPRPPALLADQAWEASHILTGAQLQVLQRGLTPNRAPGPVVDVMRALLEQARSLTLQSRRVSPALPATEILPQFRDQARLSHWRLLSVEAATPQDVVALYRFAEDKGMVMLVAERGQPANVSPPGAPVAVMRDTTEITRFEVAGTIDMRTLFRPLSPPAPALMSPALGPFPVIGPFSARSGRGSKVYPDKPRR